jgi:glucose/arabinose dehydrogenase
MMRSTVLLSSLILLALAGCRSEPEPPQFGPNPTLPEPKRGLLPSMVISKPAAWGDERPTVPEGYTIQAIATDLMIPRQSLVLPNGDILVAEGSAATHPCCGPRTWSRATSKRWARAR